MGVSKLRYLLAQLLNAFTDGLLHDDRQAESKGTRLLTQW